MKKATEASDKVVRTYLRSVFISTKRRKTNIFMMTDEVCEIVDEFCRLMHYGGYVNLNTKMYFVPTRRMKRLLNAHFPENLYQQPSYKGVWLAADTRGDATELTKTFIFAHKLNVLATLVSS